MNRCLGVLLALACAGFANAERLVNVPTSHKTLKRSAQFDWVGDQGNRRSRRLSASLPVGESWEAAVGLEPDRRSKDTLTADLSYQILAPFVDTIPGIMVGVLDAGNSSRPGRSLYASITWDAGLDGELNSNFPAELTLGAGTGRFRGIYYGAMIPLADQLRLIAEHDSRNLQAGFELRPAKGFRLRWMFRQDQTLLSFGWTARF